MPPFHKLPLVWMDRIRGSSVNTDIFEKRKLVVWEGVERTRSFLKTIDICMHALYAIRK